MPTYEYQCSACGHQLEAFQKMTDAPLTHCPQCNSEHLQKLISAAGFQLKGTGWYVTDFRDKGKKPAENKKTDTAAAPSTSDNSADKPADKTAKPDKPATSSTDTEAK